MRFRLVVTSEAKEALQQLEISDATAVLVGVKQQQRPTVGYWGIYKIVKDLAEIAGIKDAHSHQGRHAVATEMLSRGIDPLLAMQITRHKSAKFFERYSKRSLQKQAEDQFLQMGEG